jgi:hypothetical protein
MRSRGRAESRQLADDARFADAVELEGDELC